MRRAFSLAAIFELNGERKASFYPSSVSMSDVYKLRKWENASSFISKKKKKLGVSLQELFPLLCSSIPEL